VTIVLNEKAVCAWNGSDFVKVASTVITNLTGTLPATNGGTDQSSYAIGDLLYASTTTALSKLADVATGSALISGGVSTAPSWGKIGLTTHVSGTLPVANGGTGLTSGTSGGVPYYSAAGTIASSAALAANAIVLGGGAGVTPATTTTGTGVVTALGVNTGTAGAFVVNGGALGTPSSGTLSSCTVDGTDAVGFRNIPVNSQSAAYTAVLADSGKVIFHPSTDANARTFTIPANSSVAYAIGMAEPLMVSAVDENGKSLDELIAKFDFKPQSIIDTLELKKPIYQTTAAYGHFGKADLPWEKIIKI
jgi:hypothetical protein